MNIYKNNDIGELIKDNSYVGRGIVIGMSENGEKAVFAYFIMGRSENSRNRIFIQNGTEVIINAYDPSKLEDPSLIIYSPVKNYKNNIIVTNGDQTDTIYNFLEKGMTFEQALETREFEPDMPNYTPRISGILTFENNNFKYKLNILKSADEDGTACNRYSFSYSPLNGLGHFIHTYNCNGNPIPTFTGEPERVAIPDSIDDFTNNLWDSLNLENKISLYVSYVDIKNGKQETRMLNKNGGNR